MAGYVGNIPVPQGTQTRQTFTATASQTSFPTLGYTAGFIDVYLNGVKLLDTVDYTATNGSDVVLTTGAALNDILEVTIFETFTTAGTSFTNPTFIDTATVSGDTTATVTLKNNTEEDTDGGRESTVIFQGEQSGGEISTLAEIEASHDGTADDEKGDLIFRTNDGSDGTSPTEVLRTNSAGNLLITSSDQHGLTLNTTDSNGGFVRFTTSGTDKAFIGTSHHLISGGSPSEDDTTIRAEGVLQFTTGGGTERMGIDTDGKVTLNRANSGTTLQTTVPDGQRFNQIDLKHGTSQKGAIWTDDTTALMGYYVPSSWGKNFYTGGLERMRINSSGNIYIGTTSAGRASERLSVTQTSGEAIAAFTNGLASAGYIYKSLQSGAGTHYIAWWENSSGGNVGKITHNNSSTSYSTTSDYRLKENVVDLTGAITRLKQLEPKRFNFIADGDTTVDGFLAHEAQTVVPEAVTGIKDAVQVWGEHEELPDGVSVGDNKLNDDGNTIIDPQGIDQAKLVPLLTAALQEAIAKIETLETKVAALEAE